MKRVFFTLLVSTAIASPAVAETLTVAVYGGQWGAAIEGCILEKFTAATGVTTVSEPGSSLVTMTKLKQQANDPTIDVAWMDGGISEMAHRDGLVATIQPSDISELDELVKSGVHKDEAGNIFSLSTGFYSTGIVYNTSKIQTPPESWLDLWKPEYAGKVTIPSPNNANGIPMFVTLAQIAGGDMDNVEPAVKRLRELKVALYWDSAGAADNAFQSGEVVIGALHSANAWSMKDNGLPIGYAVPKEGIPAADIRVHVVKGSKHQEAATKLAAFAVSKDASECLAERLYVGPVHTQAQLSDKARERMPWGAGGSVNDLIFMNWTKLDGRRQDLTKIWNEQILAR